MNAAGCGKSVLISCLIDGLLSAKTPKTEMNVAFYYCDHADKRTLDPVNLFSSIAHQILRTVDELSPNVLVLLESIFQDGQTLEIENLINLILEATKRMASFYVFIDGLD